MISVPDYETREAAIRDVFGEVGGNPTVLPIFNCDNGNNVVVAAGAVVTKYVSDNCVIGQK